MIEWLYFEKLHRKLNLSVEFENANPILVVSKDQEVYPSPTFTDMPMMRYPDGSLVIPGSTLKGILRAGVLLLDLLEGRTTTIDPKVEKEILHDGRMGHEEKVSALPTVNKIFGSRNIRSHVILYDIVIPPERLKYKIGVGMSREYGGAVARAIYKMDVVEPQTPIKLEMNVINLPNKYLARLLGAFILMHNGTLRLGHSKSRGLGWLRFRSLEILENGKKIEKLPPLTENDTQCSFSNPLDFPELEQVVSCLWGELP